MRFFTELDSLMGSSSESLPLTSYISSNSLLELRLLHSELPSDCVSDEAGEAGTSATGIQEIVLDEELEFPVFGGIAFGVGKSSLIGEITPVRSFGGCGGALRTEICGTFSITVLRSGLLFMRSGAEGSNSLVRYKVASVAIVCSWLG